MKNVSRGDRPSTASVVPKKNSIDSQRDSSNLRFGSVTKLTDWQHHTFVSPKHEILAQLHAAHHTKKHKIRNGTMNVSGQGANDLSKQLVPQKFRQLKHF